MKFIYCFLIVSDITLIISVVIPIIIVVTFFVLVYFICRYGCKSTKGEKPKNVKTIENNQNLWL